MFVAIEGRDGVSKPVQMRLEKNNEKTVSGAPCGVFFVSIQMISKKLLAIKRSGGL